MSNRPNIQWHRTWNDDLERDDYTAWDGDRRIGRIYADSVRNEHFWRWFPGWPKVGGSTQGCREAMMALEDAYLDFLSSHPEAAETFFRLHSRD